MKLSFANIKTIAIALATGFILTLTSPSTFAAPASLGKEPAKLIGNVEVSNRLVTLGDLFENAGELSGKAVFRAPSIGQSGTIRAYRVIDAARRAGLVRIAPTDVAIVQVQRASELVTENDVTEALKSLLRSRSFVSGDGRVDVELTVRLVDQHAEPGSVQPFDLRNLRYDRPTGRFSVNLLIAGRTDIGPIRLSGTARETVMTPILTRNMRAEKL